MIEFDNYIFNMKNSYIKLNFKPLIISILFISSNYLCSAQIISLSNFNVIQDNKQVLLYWTIDSGPTCNGIAIMHSTDSINFEEIGTIAGVCGSSSSSTNYSFKDVSPILNKINYYKIRLGFSQFSVIQSLLLEYIEPGKIIIKPNPSTDNLFIGFNNKNESFSLMIFNASGSKVFELMDIRENKITINTNAFENGNYYILLMDSEGRIIKEKILISK